jgi:hypothetical protein
MDFDSLPLPLPSPSLAAKSIPRCLFVAMFDRYVQDPGLKSSASSGKPSNDKWSG